MNRISLNLIVKNEEKFIDGCLRSIVNLVDEIIIADTGSEDNTIKIAKDYPVKLLNFIWINDFSAARNFVLQNSSGDWILYLDADERIDSVFHDEIKRIISMEEAEAYLIKLKSKTITDGKEQIQIATYPRLFKNIKGLRFEGSIHEQITPSLNRIGARIKNSDIIIDHLGYSQNDDIVDAKKKRNLESLKKLVNEESNNAYAYFQLGENYLALKDQDKGIEYLKKSIEMGGLTKSVASTAYSALAQEYFKKLDFENAESFCRISLNLAKSQLFANLLLSEILQAKKEFIDAEFYLLEAEKYLKIPEAVRIIETALDVNYDLSIVYYKLGMVHLRMKQIQKSRDYFIKSLEYNEFMNESLLELGNICFQSGDFKESNKYLQRVNPEKIKDISLLMNLSGFFLEMEDFTSCSRILQLVINLEPDNAKAHYFLGNCYLNTGDFENAVQHYQLSSKIAPEISETLYNLAVGYIKMKQYSSALTEFEKLQKMLPEDDNIAKKITSLKKMLN